MMRLNQNRIMKLSSRNRVIFMRLALIFAVLSCATLTIGCSTNQWLITAEWLKYFNHSANESIPEYMLPRFFKNATMGPWMFCFEEPEVPFHCRYIDHFINEESADTTMSVEIGVRRVVFVLVASIGVVYEAFLATLVCNIRGQSALITLSTGVSHIFAGMGVLLCLVLYVANVTREVGKKIWPESTLEKPLFYYQYGHSFYFVVASYVLTQLAAFLVLSVYMARHDEQMFNRYQIRALLRSNMLASFGGVGLSVVHAKRTSGERPRNSRFSRGSVRPGGADTFSFSSAASQPHSPNDRQSAKSSTASLFLALSDRRKSSTNRSLPPPPYEQTGSTSSGGGAAYHKSITLEEQIAEDDEEEEDEETSYRCAIDHQRIPYSNSQSSTCPLLPQPPSTSSISTSRNSQIVAFNIPVVVATTSL